MDGRVKHGLVPRHNKPAEFNVWCKMRARCDNAKSADYKNYGGRGIRVCARWRDFAAFLADMGPRPTPQHTIERLNNDLGYRPSNCIWATRDVQAKNRRPRQKADSCHKGHSLSGDNLYQRPDGKRGCRECRRTNMTAFYDRRKRAA